MNEVSNNLFSSAVELSQIDVQELQIGMYISKLDRPCLESTFLFQGFEVKTVADIKEEYNIDINMLYKMGLVQNSLAT